MKREMSGRIARLDRTALSIRALREAHNKDVRRKAMGTTTLLVDTSSG
jgi:hypothetical protein